MKESFINLEFGRQAFGTDPVNYHAARPAYPEWVFEMLCDRCGLEQHTATFEIGAGTGLATWRLLDLGANPLIAIEPDKRLADFLQKTNRNKALRVDVSSFEGAVLDENGFDLGVSATAFHWLNEDSSLKKVTQLLRPGGWWAMVWNVFGNPNLSDPFHEATKTLLDGLSSPAESKGGLPFALDVEALMAALNRTGAFDKIEHRAEAWSLSLDTAQTIALYATYSNINVRPDREDILSELGRIATNEFNGLVTRNMITSLFIARCRK